ncbi:protease inhibitor I42 family protein [Streptomyces sp. NPDC020996]|uniref:protease inhibitor I42 family protein n=1 Tax=unclassified Streptomyces TaxID=2593676 RepID=UPI0033F05DE4
MAAPTTVRESLVLSERDNDGHFPVPPEGQITVALEENGSTGYFWDYSTSVEMEKVFDETAIRFPDRPGSPGVRVFSFRAPTAGEVDLKFIKHRQGQSPTETETFHIRVVR